MSFKSNQLFKSTATSAVCFSLLALSHGAAANPDGAVVVAGAAKTEIKGSTLAVQATNGTIIDWNSFGIDAGEATVITLDSSSARILNRVTGGSRSDINGRLSSNGMVFLINTNGVAVGNGAVVDTNGLVLSGLNLSNEDFASGNYRFSGGAGSITNAGTIGGGKYQGSIALIGSKVTNSGLVSTTGGDVVLAAGQKIKLASIDASNVFIELSAPENEVINLGTLNASNVIAMLAPSVTNSGTANGTKVIIDDDGDLAIGDGGGEDPVTEEPDPVTTPRDDPVSDSPTSDGDPDTGVVGAPATDEPETRPDPNIATPREPELPPVVDAVDDVQQPDLEPVIELGLVDAPRLPSFIVDDGQLLASLMQENTLEIVRLQESLESEGDAVQAPADESSSRPDTLASEKSAPGICQ